MHDLNMKILSWNKKTIYKILINITLVLTSSLFIAVRQTLLFRNEEQPVALLVYSSFIRELTSGFRISPYSLVVVVVCPQTRTESVRVIILACSSGKLWNSLR